MISLGETVLICSDSVSHHILMVLIIKLMMAHLESAAYQRKPPSSIADQDSLVGNGIKLVSSMHVNCLLLSSVHIGRTFSPGSSVIVGKMSISSARLWITCHYQ